MDTSTFGSTISRQDSRLRLAALATTAIIQTADVIQAEQEELGRRFPRLECHSAQSAPAVPLLRAVVLSTEYNSIIDTYVKDESGTFLLSKILLLLSNVAPSEFSRHG